jgi:hypothetical protein
MHVATARIEKRAIDDCREARHAGVYRTRFPLVEKYGPPRLETGDIGDWLEEAPMDRRRRYASLTVKRRRAWTCVIDGRHTGHSSG